MQDGNKSLGRPTMQNAFKARFLTHAFLRCINRQEPPTHTLFPQFLRHEILTLHQPMHHLINPLVLSALRYLLHIIIALYLHHSLGVSQGYAQKQRHHSLLIREALFIRVWYFWRDLVPVWP